MCECEASAWGECESVGVCTGSARERPATPPSLFFLPWLKRLSRSRTLRLRGECCPGCG